MADHGHIPGQRCELPGCGDPTPRAALAVDRILAEVPPGRTVPRTYLYERVAAELPDMAEPFARGDFSRRARQAKHKRTSSRGSRLTVKARNRLLRLAEVGAVELIGHDHLVVIDMGLAPPFATASEPI